MQLAPRMSTTKRADIQAMRALAVGIVVLYHLWPDKLPGGFIGVDVFFVISGFLITSHLLRSVGQERPLRFLAGFYARRIRRLAPAAATVLAFVLAATVAFLPVTTWLNTARQVIASALFVENWVLAGDSVDYLASDNAPSAVQHFWSLSVEEQFYIFWPLLILIATVIAVRLRSRRAVVPVVIGAVIVLSLAWSMYETINDPAAAYFVTPTRIWQLAAGGILAFVTVRPPRLRLILPWVGVAVIAVGSFALSAAMPYPGELALVPVVGAALVIVGGGGSGSRLSVDRVTRFRPIQWLGDTSYSIYLWHWPLIVLLPAILSVQLGSVLKLAIVALTLLLAWGSYEWIENSVRRNAFLASRPLRSFAVGVAALALIITPSVMVMDTSAAAMAQSVEALESTAASSTSCLGAAALDHPACGNPWGSANASLIAGASKDEPLPWKDDCANSEGAASHSLCVYGDTTASSTVLLWGDSHSGAWAPAFDTAGKLGHFKVIVAMRYACPSTQVAPIATTEHAIDPAQQANCLERNQWVLRSVAPRADQVVLANMSTHYTFPGGSSHQADGYAATLDGLAKLKRPVAMLQDLPLTGATPALQRDGPACLNAHAGNCTNPATHALATNAVEKSLLARGYGNTLRYVPTADRFCHSGTCYYAIGGVSVYFDTSHLSNTYSASLGPWLVRALRNARPLSAGM
ncbi:acyltransferase family protein [Leifsonia sp. NPDC056665]|uniref:acyltransferase family protein n=1 Tax=Leifsonia sp. NPDC056665 TaxID=3345901 RepID=UPI00369F3D50